jgi:hypothetical protein
VEKISMIESMLVVLSKARDGRDDELNDWYTNIHVRDALRFRGSIAAQRFAITEERPGPLPADWAWRYLALYECDDAVRFSQEHREAADSVRMEIAEAFDNSVINDYYYFPLSWRTNDPGVVRSSGVIVEFVNPAPGRDDELRAFYEGYLAEASRRPGVHSAAFLAYRNYGQMLSSEPAHRYVAIYWTVNDEAAVQAWTSGDALVASGLVDEASLAVVAWRRLTRRLTSDDVTHSSSADLAAEEAARKVLQKRKPTGRSTREALGLA